MSSFAILRNESGQFWGEDGAWHSFNPDNPDLSKALLFRLEYVAYQNRPAEIKTTPIMPYLPGALLATVTLHLGPRITPRVQKT